MDENENEKLSNQIRAEAGEFAKDNHFVTSPQFMGIVRAFSRFPKLILMGTGGPGEAVNAFMSLTLTFLRNIPDEAWKTMVETVNKTEGADHVKEAMAQLEAFRNFRSEHFVEVDEEPMPNFTTKPPIQPQ